MIKAILFDFDGTLANTTQGIIKTMAATFTRMSLPIPSAEDMAATIGLPLKTSLQTLGHLNEEDAEKATAIYRELFPVFEVENVTLFPDTLSTLEALREKGLRMAVVTSRDTPSLHLIMSPRGMLPFFEAKVTGSDGLLAKPAPDMVLSLLSSMSLRPEEALVVGDTTYDIIMGQSANCPTCAVTYGNHSCEILSQHNPTYIIHSLHDILKVGELASAHTE